MTNPGDTIIRVEHVIEALEQMDGVIYRLLRVFRAIDRDTVLVVSGQAQPTPPAPQPLAATRSTVQAAVEPLPRIEPLPALKDNCTAS